MPRREANGRWEAARGERVLSPLPREEDHAQEAALRPASFAEFVGQEKLCRQLGLFVGAARGRGDVLDHVLLSGPPGLGKTSLAFILAREMGGQVTVTTGPALDKPGSLAGLLTKLERGSFLFIDEIHRLRPVLEEYLYSALEDFRLDVVLDPGPAARTVHVELQRFTLVGATTREGLLSAPLLSRFPIRGRLDYYAPPDLERILERSARLLGIGLEPAGRAMIARRARGTPRVANRLLRRLRDVAQMGGAAAIGERVAREGLELLGVDEAGLEELDRRILEVLARQGGQPVGLKTVAVSVGEEEDTVEEVYEPFLIREGLLLKTPRGRTITAAGLAHLGREPPRGGPLLDAPGGRRR